MSFSVISRSEDASSDGSASGGSASQAPAGDLPKHQTTLPKSWTGGPDKTVSIAAAPGLEYDLREFEVKAGSRVKLVLTNPTDLQHNLVIVAPGTWSEVAQKAINLGLEGPEMDYVPETDNVHHYTSLLDRGDRRRSTSAPPLKRATTLTSAPSPGTRSPCAAP